MAKFLVGHPNADVWIIDGDKTKSDLVDKLKGRFYDNEEYAASIGLGFLGFRLGFRLVFWITCRFSSFKFLSRLAKSRFKFYRSEFYFSNNTTVYK